ncbi:MAG TPA: hypothetical protein VL498_06850 [Terracidiphilus sp.]|jgi:hypothetical protein|nr:hypothetical protein [Terracidiphilus sp.]
MNRKPSPETAQPYPFEAILEDIQNRSRRRLDRFNLLAALMLLVGAIAFFLEVL